MLFQSFSLRPPENTCISASRGPRDKEKKRKIIRITGGTPSPTIYAPGVRALLSTLACFSFDLLSSAKYGCVPMSYDVLVNLCVCVFVYLYFGICAFDTGEYHFWSLNNHLFKNIPHCGSFWHFVISCICVFVCLCICVFVFGLGRSLLDQFGQKNASPLSSTFWFEQPKLRYELKTVLHCKM